MKMKRKWALITIMVIVLAVVISFPLIGFGEKNFIELSLGTKMPPDSIEGVAYQKFADLVEEKSNGELIVIVYPSEQLGDNMTQTDNVLLGTQDMFAEGSDILSRFDKDYALASLPYLFRDYDHFHKTFTGPIGQRMSENLLKKGLRILNEKRNFRRGPYRVICSTFPIRSIEDVQGLKMRAFDTSTYVQAWVHLGAKPLVIAWSETYLAIKQNMVDAVTTPISLVCSMSFTEVAPHVTNINEYMQDIVIFINNNKFESLSAEHQNILVEAANEAGEVGTQLLFDELDGEIQKMKDRDKAVFYDIDTEPFRERLRDFYYTLEDKGYFSKGIIDEILNM